MTDNMGIDSYCYLNQEIVCPTQIILNKLLRVVS